MSTSTNGHIRAVRQLPQDIEAEMAFVGAMIYDNRIIDEYTESFDIEYLHDDQAKYILIAVREVHASGEMAEPIAIADCLKRHRNFDKAGGYDRLNEFVEAGQMYWNAPLYASIIKSNWKRRETIKACLKTIETAYAGHDEADGMAESLAAKLMDMTQRGAVSEVLTMRQAGMNWKRLFKKRRDGELEGLPTGFTDLDDLIGGYGPGRMIVIAGRPGHGKSAFAMNSGEKMARTGAKGLIVSREMGHLELFERLVSSRSRIVNTELRDMAMDDHRDSVYQRADAAADEILDLPFHIDDTSGVNIGKIESICRRLRAQSGLEFVMVDYLQLIEADSDFRANRQEVIAKISRRLKLLARSLNIPIIVLSQLNRLLESREEKRPLLSDI